jgi:hypothetical protein
MARREILAVKGRFMLQREPILKIDEVAPRFWQLIDDAGTSREKPSLQAVWEAFARFCREPVDCDEERLFFECDLSNVQPDSFYVHFARTCYGREPKGHVWSHEVICDFLFALDEELEEFSHTVEAEEISATADSSDDRERFLEEVQSQPALWQALSQRQPTHAEIYIGES